MTAKLTFLITSVFLISFSISAQSDFRDGYIITTDGEKIQCKVLYRSKKEKYEKCIFKKGTFEVSYGPQDLLRFGYDNNKSFVTGIKEGEFVEELLAGEFMSLFLGSEGYLIKKGEDIHLLELEPLKRKRVDGKQVTTRNLRWRGILVSLLADCVVLTDEQISKLNYREKDLIEQVQVYNVCKGGEAQEVKKPVNLITVEAELVFGLNHSARRQVPGGSFSFYDWTGERRSTNSIFGVNLLLTPDRYHDRIAFVTGFSVTELRMEGTISNEGSDLQIKSLDIPVAVRLMSRKKKSKFFFQGGVEFKRNRDTLSGRYNRNFRRPSLQLIGGFSRKIEKGSLGFMVGTSPVREDITRFFISLLASTEIFK